MKTIRIVMMVMTGVQSALAQFGEIPPQHYHIESVCYRYAMGRSFGKTSWFNDPGGCNLNSLHPNPDGGSGGSVDPIFFLFSTSVGGTAVGDILAFEQQGSIFLHVAYVSYVGEGGFNIDVIRVDQVPFAGGPEQKNILLRDVIEGNNGQTARGWPAGRYRKRALWHGTIKNQFSDNSDGGTLRLIIPGEGESHPNSPYSLQNRYWGETFTIDAEMNGTVINGLTQVFSNWDGQNESIGAASSQESPLYINWTHSTNAVTSAVFRGRLEISGTKVIQSGTTVTIDQTTIIDIQENSELVIYGRLVVNGTPSQHVVFASPPGTTWKGIKFEGSGANNSSLSYCDINQALSPVVATSVGSLTISNCTISNSSFGGDAALHFYGSSPTITSLVVTGQSNSANGIRFASGSSGSISASTIQNCGAGNGIVIEGNSYPTISNNTITGNRYHGIIANSNPAFPTITGNVITNNGVVNGVKTYTGITFYNSHGNVMSNTIEGSNYGIYAENLSFPRSFITTSDAGNNLVRDNLYGLVAYDNSEMDFGYHDGSFTYGACNKIYLNTTWDAFANVSSTIRSQGTYWLYSPPQKISSANNSSVDSSCYMTSEFNCGSVFCDPSPKLAGSATNGFDGEAELKQARSARIAGDYQRATGLYTNVLSTSAQTGESLEALRGLYQVFLQTKSPDLIERVVSYESGSGVVAVAAAELEMLMHAGKGDFDAVKLLAAELRSKYPGTETEKKSLILLASLGGFDESQRATSAPALSELKQKYGSSVDAGLLAALGSDGSDEPKTTEEAVQGDGLSLSNHPNPFNPMTVIRFSLPADGNVSLKVFDALGREVATLVNGFRTAGQHQIDFNASKLSSGVYLYRLEAGGKIIIQKMMLLK